MADVIQLISPVMDSIPGHIAQNSCCRRCGGLLVRRTPCGSALLKDRVPPKDVPAFIAAIAQRSTEEGVLAKDPNLIKACECEEPDQYPLVQRNAYKGKSVMICGSGPSLKEAAKLLLPTKSKKRQKRYGTIDHVWGCNDAAVWLTENGYKCTHGVGIDQTNALETEAWPNPPHLPYLLATSVDPKLIAHLEKAGVKGITLFHSFIGFQGEQHVYALLYGKTVLAGEGLNVVNRAINVAEWLGYSKIYVGGADCAFELRPDRRLNFHVQGDPVEGLVLEGVVHGRPVWTKPDMLVSAIALANTKKRMGSRLEFIGDVLPDRIKHWRQEDYDRMIRWATPEETEEQQAQARMADWAPRLKQTSIAQLLEGGAVGESPQEVWRKRQLKKQYLETAPDQSEGAELRMLESDSFKLEGEEIPPRAPSG